MTFWENLFLGLLRHWRALLVIVAVGLLVLILGKAGCSVPRFGRGRESGAPASQAIEQAVQQAQTRGLSTGATPFPANSPPLKVQKTLGDRLGFLWGWLPWLLVGGLIFWVLNRVFGGLGLGSFVADLLGGGNGNGNNGP